MIAFYIYTSFCVFSEFTSKMERRAVPNYGTKPKPSLNRSLSNNDMAQEEKNDGSISDSAVSTDISNGRIKRRPSLGYKMAALVGLSRKSSSTSHLSATNKKHGQFEVVLHVMIFSGTVSILIDVA